MNDCSAHTDGAHTASSHHDYGSFYHSSSPGRSLSAPPSRVAGLRSVDICAKLYQAPGSGGGRRLFAEVNGVSEQLGHEIFGSPQRARQARASAELFAGAHGVASRAPRTSAPRRVRPCADGGACGKPSAELLPAPAALWADGEGARGRRRHPEGWHADAHRGAFAGAAGASSHELRAVGRRPAEVAPREAEGGERGEAAAGEWWREAYHLSCKGEAMPRRAHRTACGGFGASSEEQAVIRLERHGFWEEHHQPRLPPTVAAAHAQGAMVGGGMCSASATIRMTGTGGRVLRSDAKLHDAAGADSRKLGSRAAETVVCLNEQLERRPRRSTSPSAACFEGAAGQPSAHPSRHRELADEQRPLCRSASAPSLPPRGDEGEMGWDALLQARAEGARERSPRAGQPSSAFERCGASDLRRGRSKRCADLSHAAGKLAAELNEYALGRGSKRAVRPQGAVDEAQSRCAGGRGDNAAGLTSAQLYQLSHPPSATATRHAAADGSSISFGFHLLPAPTPPPPFSGAHGVPSRHHNRWAHTTPPKARVEGFEPTLLHAEARRSLREAAPFHGACGKTSLALAMEEERRRTPCATKAGGEAASHVAALEAGWDRRAAARRDGPAWRPLDNAEAAPRAPSPRRGSRPSSPRGGAAATPDHAASTPRGRRQSSPSSPSPYQRTTSADEHAPSVPEAQPAACVNTAAPPAVAPLSLRKVHDLEAADSMAARIARRRQDSASRCAYVPLSTW